MICCFPPERQSSKARDSPCKRCERVILKTEPMCRAYDGGRFSHKLCVACGVPTDACTDAEMAALTAAFNAHRRKMRGEAPTPTPPTGSPCGFYGKFNSDGDSWRQRHPCSNFFREPFTVPGVGTFPCSENVIMLLKALMFKDAHVAHALLKGHPGSTSKMLGRMIRNFDANKWKPKSVARYVTRVKGQQCPKFIAEVRKCKGRRIYECSNTDAIWGTGTPLSAWPDVGTGLNYLGEAITLLTCST